jgi:predicted DNA-binding transcriptional regulator AlpA
MISNNRTPDKIAGEGFLPARTVLARYSISGMALHRWLADEGMAFPRPIYIGRFRYWRLSDLVEWENALPRMGVQHGAARVRAERP